MKKIIVILLVVALGVGVFVYINKNKASIDNTNTGNNNTPSVSEETGSPKDATYSIEGEKVTLKNGISSVPSVNGSSSMVTTQYFGNEVKHDFDGDGRVDTGFILTQNGGGTGTFYYFVIGLNKASGYVGSEGYYLGDRIAPQTTEMSQNPSTPNVVVVNYADRKPTDSFATSPSVGKSVYLLLDTKTMQFGIVDQNFSGEADVSKMTLSMKTWNFIRADYSDGKSMTPKVANKFTLTFKSGGVFAASTDCNGIGGNYKVTGTNLAMTQMVSTMMFCSGSQESEFRTLLQNTASYHFTSKGELILDLKLDSGTVTFR
jgi:heat shock protein HslJ